VDHFLERLNRIPRIWRIVLCGLVALMVLPILSNLLDLTPLIIVGVGVYAVGWWLWIGFDANMRTVGTGALLYLVIGVSAFVIWGLYHLVLLLLVK
jgi:hypothetical protein